MKTYEIELKIVLSEEEERKVVAAARLAYSTRIASTQDDDGTTREIPVEEFVDGPVSAVLEIVRRNTVLEDMGILVDSVSCNDPDHDVRTDSFDEDESPDEEEQELADDEGDELDEWDGGLYLCRWPNGEFSVVGAESKRDAMIQLDEWAAADESWIVPLNTFMVDFTLDDLGRIGLGEFGEETEHLIRHHCYPELEAVLTHDDVVRKTSGDYSPDAKQKIKQAVQHERTRLWNDQPTGLDASTEIGKQIQARLGTTGTVANHYVKVAAKNLLKSKLGDDEMPN